MYEFIARNGLIAQNNSIITGSLTVTGTITATTLVAQTITSSTSWITGSTKFGSITSNTHQFTGSIYQSGSEAIFAGNVGIGTTSPNSILEIASSTPVFRIAASDNSQFHGIEFRQGGGFDAFIKQLPQTGEFRISNGRSAGWGGFTTFYTDTSERMRITSGGNVGIGNPTPTQLLHILGTNAANNGITIQNTNSSGNSQVRFLNTSGTERAAITYVNSADAVYHYTAGGGNILNLVSANVGIGTTSPSYKLDVNGSIGLSGFRFADKEGNYTRIFEPAGGVAMYLGNATDPGNYYDNTNHNFRPRGGGSFYMVINSGGNVGINSTAPVEKLDVSGDPVFGSATERLSLRSGAIGFNRKTSDGVIYDSSRFAYQFNHTPSATNTSDYLALQVYNGSGAAITSTALVINGVGNVGIGTATPGYLLDVAGSSRSDLHIFRSNQSAPTADAFIFRPADNTVALGTANTERLRINSGGNVGIGTTSPSNKLHVYGGRIIIDDTLANQSAIQFNSAGTEMAVLYRPATTNTQIRLFTAVGGDVMTWSGSNVGIGTTSPSAKLHVSGGDAILRNAFIGEVPTYTAANTQFSHISRAGAGEYSFLSANDGTTFINAKTGYDINFRINNSNVAIITSGGNVGIGTTSPGYKLDVGGSIYYSGVVTSGGLGGRLWIPGQAIGQASNAGLYGLALTYLAKYDSGWKSVGGGYASAITSDEGIFSFSNSQGVGAANAALTWTTRLIIDTSGNVGIGTTSPSAKLQVDGTGLFNSSVTAQNIYSVSDNSEQIVIKTAADNNKQLIFGRTSTNARIIAVTQAVGYVPLLLNPDGGAVGIGTTSPTSDLHVYNNSDVWHFRAGGASGELRIGGQNGSGAVIQAYTPGGTVRDLYIQRDGGNVGIGTTSPGYKLDVAGAIRAFGAGNAGLIQSSDTSVGGASIFLDPQQSTGVPQLVTYGNFPIVISTNNSERMRVTSAGNVGIGTTSVNEKLSVAGNISIANANGTKIGFNTTDAFTAYGYSAAHYGISYDFGTNPTALSGYFGLGIFTVGTERMRITGGGDVGIGTTSPNIGGWSRALTIRGTANAAFEVTDNTVRIAVFVSAATIGGVTVETNHPLGFYTNGTERMRITTTGNVGIGTTAPSTALHIARAASVSPAIRLQTTDSTTNGSIQWSNSSNTILAVIGSNGNVGDSAGNLEFMTGGVTTRMMISSSGNIGIGITTPSAKLQVSGSTNVVNIIGSGSASATSIFSVDGNNGRLFEITDDLSDSVFSANTIAGLPVIEAFSDYTVRLGTYGGASGSTVNITGSNVGIGTTSPGAKLHVVGSGLTEIRNTNGASSFKIITGTGFSTIGTLTNDPLVIVTNDTERMRITSGGNVGIGTTSPTYKLQVENATNDLYISAVGDAPSLNLLDASPSPTIAGTIGLATGPNYFIQNSVPGDLCILTRGVSSGASYIMFGSGSTMTAYISGSGDMYIKGTLTQGSTRNIKENIAPISNALSTVVQIQGVTYDKKDGSAINEPGFIAEDMYSVLPSLVSSDRNGDPQGIKYTNLTAYLVEAIKELKAEIDILKNK
jgi:hypothetical protein